MSISVVLYSEGGGETRASEKTALVAPAEPVPQDAWGPAHWLIARVLDWKRRIPVAAVKFVAPLRTKGGTIAKGSQLLDGRTLRRLLTFPNPDLRPELVVVLVDADGKQGRETLLRAHLEGLEFAPPVVIGVAVQEFETWLVADGEAVRDVLNAVGAPQNPESLQPRQAKTLLAGWLGRAHPPRPGAELRCTLARSANLEKIAEACSAFASFAEQLRG